MVMQEMFKRARQSRLIPYDPAELLELPHVQTHQRRSITEEERAAILAVAEHHRAGLWVLTLLYTGMRPGETAALTWADVDFVNNEIHVHAAKESGSQAIKGPKTDSGVRTYRPFRPSLEAQNAKKNSFAPVFPTGAGNFQNENSLRRLWTGFKRELDLYLGAKTERNRIVESVVAPDLTPYCLRHTFCTDLQKAGVPLNVAKELMGHSDIQMTANIYTHRDAQHSIMVSALLDGTRSIGGGNGGGNREMS